MLLFVQVVQPVQVVQFVKINLETGGLTLIRDGVKVFRDLSVGLQITRLPY